MYRLYLCLRYLKSRAIAYFAVLGVTLCVAMMIIVVSVMTGFVDKVEKAAKGLSGDITMESEGQFGIGYYDEFIAYAKKEVAEIEAASPYIQSYGLLRLVDHTNYRHAVQVAGIRLPDHAQVSDFEKGLFAQKDNPKPTWDPPLEVLKDAIEREEQRCQKLVEQIEAKSPKGVVQRELVRRIQNAQFIRYDAKRNLNNIDANRKRLAELEKELRTAEEEGASDEALEELQKRITLYQSMTYEKPELRTILGLGLPSLSFRTPKGKTVRLWVPGHKILLYVFPMGMRSLDMSSIQPELRNLSVIDDCSTDVFSVDSATVYVPFDTLQRINNMSAQYAADDPSRVVEPARCSQIQFKIKDGYDLELVREKIEAAWIGFKKKFPWAAKVSASIQTWRQRQRVLVSTVESQRTLMIIILGIISLVALVLIFVIFYMIVMQKTRDIGVLKSIGASSSGVAGIFLDYGAAVGVVGSALGALLGYLFVNNINPIADWLARNFGFQVWDREFFMFEKIPNEVQPGTVLAVVIGAIIAGLLGALVPAIRAARMQPVEALRYE